MAGRWLVLIHRIPPKPAYFRAKVLRRLNQLGALPIKKSVYALPATDDSLEDFQWLIRQIADEHGEAWLFHADVVEGYTDISLEEAFRTARAEDYAALATQARTTLDSLRAERTAESPPLDSAAAAQELSRLDRAYEALRRIDFFDAPEREEVDILMDEIRRAARDSNTTDTDQPDTTTDLREMRGRTWATRAGVKIDRMASAWFIRRFIDPAAVFVFLDPSVAVPEGAVRFDMFEGEFTHEGDLCTFEVLLRRSGIADRGLQAIGEIVHDIDFKDGQHDRPETVGVARIVDGIVASQSNDHKRLEASGTIFDGLHVQLQTRLP